MRVGVALGNAGEVGVVASLDCSFVTCEGYSISEGSLGLHSYLRSRYSVN